MVRSAYAKLAHLDFINKKIIELIFKLNIPFVNLIAFLYKLISKKHEVAIMEFPDWVQVKKIYYSMREVKFTSVWRNRLVEYK